MYLLHTGHTKSHTPTHIPITRKTQRRKKIPNLKIQHGLGLLGCLAVLHHHYCINFFGTEDIYMCLSTRGILVARTDRAEAQFVPGCWFGFACCKWPFFHRGPKESRRPYLLHVYMYPPRVCIVTREVKAMTKRAQTPHEVLKTSAPSTGPGLGGKYSLLLTRDIAS